MLASAVCAFVGTAARAECASPFGAWWMNQGQRSGFVFDGTVLRLDGVIAQMEVHRVFMGRLPARLELHAFQTLEDTPIAAGERYVMAIERKSPWGVPPVVPHRPFTQPEDDPTLVWGTLPCAGALHSVLRQHGALEHFGTGWPPER